MTEKVMTVKGEDEVGKVAKIMLNKHIKRLPVVDDIGHLVGIVSRADIVKMFL
jgi:CBS domain-containing protein